MKFLFVAPRFHTNLYYPVKIILDHGHEVDFLALGEGQSEDRSLLQPTVLFVSRDSLPPVVKYFKAIYKSRADVLVVRDIMRPYAFLALVVGKLLGKKLVVMTQIPKYRPKRKSGAVALLAGLFKAQALTPVKGDPRFPNDNKNLIYVPFSAPVLPVSRKEKDYVTILTVGKFQARKNQLLLLEALQSLRDQYKLRLILSGEENEPDYLERVKTFIKEHSLGSLVTIAPHRPWQEMKDLYEASDIFVLPSSGEPAAYSVLEAMAAGLPVISSDDNGTSSYIEDGKNGFIFRHDDACHLAEVLRRLVESRELRRRFGGHSLELVKKNHNAEIFYQALLAAIGKKC